MLKCLQRLVCYVQLMAKPSTCSQSTYGLEILAHFAILPTMIPISSMLPKSNDWYREARAVCLSPKKKALHQYLASQWYWMGTYSIACEVLSQGRWEPVFPNMQSLAREQDKTWLQKQHHGSLVSQDLWWLGSLSQIPPRHWSRKGTVSQCLHKEKYEWPCC